MGNNQSKFRLAHQKRNYATNKFGEKIRDFVVMHNASEIDKILFREMLGYGNASNTILASNLLARKKASKFLGESLEGIREQDESLTFQFWTLLHSRGHTSDRQPSIDLHFLRSLTDKTFRRLGLNAFYVVELQGLGNSPQAGQGRTIMTHVHAITWSENKLSIDEVMGDAWIRRMWASDLDAQAIKIKHVIPRAGELSYLAYYLFKPPYEAKMLEQRAMGPKLKSTEKGYRPEFAARLFEALSQMELKELIRSTGTGKSVRSDLQRRLGFWQRSRKQWTNGQIPSSFYEELWSRFRVKKRKCEYFPVTIIRQSGLIPGSK